LARVTLRDVAEASGVAQSTVSFVLNDDPRQKISAATQERVRKAAQDLGYVPNGIARALMEGTSRTVVLTIDAGFEGNYSHRFIRGLDEELQKQGFVLLVMHGRSSPSDRKHVSDVIAPRAVIQFADAYLSGDELHDSGEGWKNGMAAHVLLQFRYLAEQGHRSIALGLPDGDVPLAEVRLGFVAQATSMLDIDPVAPFRIPRDRDQAAPALQQFTSDHPQITAVAAFDDDTALRTLTAMRDLRLRAPQDLAVIGFDQNEYAALWDPRLTTILADSEGHGRLAARRALGLDTDGVEAAAGRVIVRDSA
jgi:DNA-binding LacI/PurR family transcriptional regulator